MEPLLNIAVGAARQAGEIIVRHMQQVEHLKIATKNNQEYFSEVDVKAEQAIIQAIRKVYPSHNILAEESGLHDQQSEVLWLVDPLDGTTNYLHEFPYYAVSIAIKIKNKIEHGVVFDPLRQECFTASRGNGARLNERRLRVSKQTQLEAALLATGMPLRDLKLAQKFFPTLQALVGKCAGIRGTGASALDLAYVASGRLDGYWKFGLRPWDIAAATLIIREAGGMVSDVYGGEEFLKSGDVVAGTPKIFKALLQTVTSVLRGNQ